MMEENILFEKIFLGRYMYCRCIYKRATSAQYYLTGGSSSSKGKGSKKQCERCQQGGHEAKECNLSRLSSM